MAETCSFSNLHQLFRIDSEIVDQLLAKDAELPTSSKPLRRPRRVGQQKLPLQTQNGRGQLHKCCDSGSSNEKPGVRKVASAKGGDSGESVSNLTKTGENVSSLTNTGDSASSLTNTGKSVSSLTNTRESVSSLTNTRESVSSLTNTRESVSSLTNTRESVSSLTNTRESVSSLTNTRESVSSFTNTRESMSSLTNTRESVSSLTNTRESMSSLTNTRERVSSLTNTRESVSSLTNSSEKETQFHLKRRHSPPPLHDPLSLSIDALYSKAKNYTEKVKLKRPSWLTARLKLSHYSSSRSVEDNDFINQKSEDKSVVETQQVKPSHEPQDLEGNLGDRVDSLKNKILKKNNWLPSKFKLSKRSSRKSAWDSDFIDLTSEDNGAVQKQQHEPSHKLGDGGNVPCAGTDSTELSKRKRKASVANLNSLEYNKNDLRRSKRLKRENSLSDSAVPEIPKEEGCVVSEADCVKSRASGEHCASTAHDDQLDDLTEGFPKTPASKVCYSASGVDVDCPKNNACDNPSSSADSNPCYSGYLLRSGKCQKLLNDGHAGDNSGQENCLLDVNKKTVGGGQGATPNDSPDPSSCADYAKGKLGGLAARSSSSDQHGRQGVKVKEDTAQGMLLHHGRRRCPKRHIVHRPTNMLCITCKHGLMSSECLLCRSVKATAKLIVQKTKSFKQARKQQTSSPSSKVSLKDRRKQQGSGSHSHRVSKQKKKSSFEIGKPRRTLTALGNKIRQNSIRNRSNKTKGKAFVLKDKNTLGPRKDKPNPAEVRVIEYHKRASEAENSAQEDSPTFYSTKDVFSHLCQLEERCKDYDVGMLQKVMPWRHTSVAQQQANGLSVYSFSLDHSHVGGVWNSIFPRKLS